MGEASRRISKSMDGSIMDDNDYQLSKFQLFTVVISYKYLVLKFCPSVLDATVYIYIYIPVKLILMVTDLTDHTTIIPDISLFVAPNSAANDTKKENSVWKIVVEDHIPSTTDIMLEGTIPAGLSFLD